MAIHPLAGQLAPASVLIDVPALEHAYYTNRPDPGRSTAARRFRHQRASRDRA